MRNLMKPRMKQMAGAVLILLTVVFFAAGSVQAAGWEHELSIYGWFAGIDATTKFPVEGDTVEVDASDVLEDLNGVFMGNYAGKYDRWSIILDAVFLDVGDSGSTNVAGRDVAMAFDMKTWLLTGVVAYDLVQDSWGSFAVAGGTRYLDLEVDADLSINDTPLSGVNESTGLWDGFIGLRGVFLLNENWFIPYSADIGAGGSDLSYQLFAAIGYQFGGGDIRLGYRYLYYDLGDGKVLKDLSTGGPLLGLGFRF